MKAIMVLVSVRPTEVQFPQGFMPVPIGTMVSVDALLTNDKTGTSEFRFDGEAVCGKIKSSDWAKHTEFFPSHVVD